MPAATDVIAVGDLLDLPVHCPPRCVTWSADETCWGLARLPGRQPRLPETAVYRVVGPVDDPEAWTESTGVVPELAPAGVGAPPPADPPAPPGLSDPSSPDPVERVMAVFGPGVQLIGDPAHLKHLGEKLLDAQGRRDRAVLDEPAWEWLAAAVAGDDTGELIGAGRAVIGWCRAEDPERLGLGGWKRLVGQVEAFEGVDPRPVTRLLPWRCECPEAERVPKEPCRQQYHTGS